jgi:hypothetical protein
MTSISAYSGSSAWATTSGTERAGRAHRSAPSKLDDSTFASSSDAGSTAVGGDSSSMPDLMPPPSSTVDFAQQRGVDGPPPGPPPGMDGDTMKLMQDVFKAADTDGDGTLSDAETSRLSTQIESALGADSSTSSTTASSSNQGPDILAALLEKVLKQYGGTAADTSSQTSATNSISATA